MGNKNVGLSQIELEKLLIKWQKILGLGDYDLNVKIVDFTRTDYRQSGDFEIDLETKKGAVLLTREPFLIQEKTVELEEEHTLLHELVHILLWEMDMWVEEKIVTKYGKNSVEHGKYLEKLEKTVAKLTERFWEIKNPLT